MYDDDDKAAEHAAIIRNADRLAVGLKEHGVNENLVDRLHALVATSNRDAQAYIAAGKSPQDMFTQTDPRGAFTLGQVEVFEASLAVLLDDTLGTFMKVYTMHKMADAIGHGDQCPTVDDVVDVPNMARRLESIVSAWEALQTYTVLHSPDVLTDADLDALLAEAGDDGPEVLDTGDDDNTGLLG